MKNTARNILWVLLATLPVVGLANHQPEGVDGNKTANTLTSDSVIVAQIDSEINNEPLLKNASVRISSSYGNITLSALVDTELQAEKIVTIVQSNKWVKDINTKNLKVKNSNIPLTDTYITAKVKGALIRDKLLDVINPGAIKVETMNKVVYLSGDVANQAQKDKIINSVKSLRGVNTIKDGLKIKP